MFLGFLALTRYSVGEMHHYVIKKKHLLGHSGVNLVEEIIFKWKEIQSPFSCYRGFTTDE
jgi:hypothetical protein